MFGGVEYLNGLVLRNNSPQCLETQKRYVLVALVLLANYRDYKVIGNRLLT